MHRAPTGDFTCLYAPAMVEALAVFGVAVAKLAEFAPQRGLLYKIKRKCHGVPVTLDSADLVEIEALKQLKARYCRLLDAKDWTAWRRIFTDDFVSDTSKAGGKVIEGADDFVAFTRGNLAKPSQVTAHQVHAPEIELTSQTTARGIWALEDVVRLAPGINLRGYGHYHETYQKVDGHWLIKTSTLTRLREDIFNVFVSVFISDRIKRATAGLARRVTK